MAEKKKNLQDMTTLELTNRLNDAREELMNLRFQLATGELTDYTRLKAARQMVARVLTILNARHLVEKTEGEA